MKKLYVTLVFFALYACFMGASAQRTHLPILEEGKEWHYKHFVNSLYEGIPTYFKTKVLGDTVINDTLATKLGYFPGNEIITEERLPTKTYFVYEDNGRYYLYHGKYFVLYLDFNYTTGDRITPVVYLGNNTTLLKYDFSFKIINDKLSDVFGVQRRIIIITNRKFVYWIEGIGALDPIYVMYLNCAIIKTQYEQILLSGCYKDGECLFTDDWMWNYLEEEYSGVNEIANDRPEGAGERQPLIFDLYGRMVTRPQRGAVYIVDGKKMVWQRAECDSK